MESTQLTSRFLFGLLVLLHLRAALLRRREAPLEVGLLALEHSVRRVPSSKEETLPMKMEAV